MKKRANKILFFAVLSCMMAPVMAQTVDVTLQCGQTYTINSTVAATAGATYRWLENGSTVTGTAANYTVANKSVGVYTYIRQAKSAGCADWQNSNAFTVEVKNKNDDGVCIAGVMWAKYNVDEPGSFTASLGDFGMLYKWDSLIYIPALGTERFAFPALFSPNNAWAAQRDPCPANWRVPSSTALVSLFNATPTDPISGVKCLLGSASAGSAVKGYWLGPDAHSTGPNAIFFPSVHLSYPSAPSSSGGHYWTSTSGGDAAYAYSILEDVCGLNDRWKYIPGSVRCIME
jgi:uncharacterized protein (TIGR02145 family)